MVVHSSLIASHNKSEACSIRDAPANTDASARGLERSSEAALQAVVYGAARFKSVDELMLHNALALHRRQLLRLRAGDDWAEVMQVRPGLCS